MSPYFWLILSVGNVFLLTRVLYLRMELAKFKTPIDINVIDGYILPSADDPRWTRVPDSWNELLMFDLGKIRISRKEPNRSEVFRTWGLRIEGNKVSEGRYVKRYFQAIERAYIQRQAQRAIDGFGQLP